MWLKNIKCPIVFQLQAKRFGQELWVSDNQIKCIACVKEKWIGKVLSYQGAKKVIFKACHSGKLKLCIY